MDITEFKKLPPDMKDRWVTALRSGKYQQDYKSLKGRHGHCCLGVLATIEGVPCTNDCYGGYVFQFPSKSTPGWWRETLYGKFSGYVNSNTELNGDLAELVDSLAASVLVDMNDGHLCEQNERVVAKSFDQIADWIEANL